MNETVVVVTNIPRPYRTALFATLKEQLRQTGLQLKVVYTSDPAKHVRRRTQSPRLSDPGMELYSHGVDIRMNYDRVLAIPLGLGRTLKNLQPTCVVTAGFGPSALATARFCRRADVPYVIWSGAWPNTEGELGRTQKALRRRLVRHAGAFISYGTAAADYLATLGAPAERIFPAWNTVDLEGIASRAQAAAQRRAELTETYGLSARNLLFIGSLVERKGVRELVTAALAANPATSDWTLHFAADGPLRDELSAQVLAAGREKHFRFHGSLPPIQVAELLGVADGFFLPTKREAWGLVINEAMACGVPVVVSPLAGATRDLVEDGVTGFVVHPSDITALAGLVERLASGDPECQKVGRAGAEAVRAKASLDRTAANFAAGIRCAMEHGDRA